MTQKLPKHIAQMVEKNNLALAIKTLADDANISMSDAKISIDAYEAQLKTQQDKKVQAIAHKQGVSMPSMPAQSAQSIQPLHQSPTQPTSALNAPTHSITAGLDQHLKHIGYKKPLLPYWAKRVIGIMLVIVLLGMLIWRLLT